jgi:hypothetical protein
MEPSKHPGWLDRSLPTFKAMARKCFAKRKPPTRFQIWFGRVLQITYAALILAFIGWRWQLNREVDSLLASYRAAGLPTNGEELNAFYPAVPDNENAALHIMQAAELLQEYPDDRLVELRRFQVPRRGEDLSPDQEVLLQGYIDLNRNALAKVIQALELPKSRYPVDLSAGLYADLAHIGRVRQLGQLFQYQCLLALAENRLDDAVHSIKQVVGLTRSLDNEPMLLSSLTRDALLFMAVRCLERTLNPGPLNEQQLTQLSESFDGVHQANIFARALAGEVASIADCLALNQPEMFEGPAPTDEADESPALGRVALGAIRFSGLYARDLRFYLRGMQTNLALAKLPPPECLDMTNHLAEMVRQADAHHHINVSIILPAMPRVVPKAVDAAAVLTVGRTGIAVEQFRLDKNRLPKALADLAPEYLDSVPIDPFDGQPLRFRKLDPGYMIYSVGMDGQDDGGNEPPLRIKSTDTNSYDLTFIVER